MTPISFPFRVDSLKECQLTTSHESITKLFKYLPTHEAFSRISLTMFCILSVTNLMGVIHSQHGVYIEGSQTQQTCPNDGTPSHLPHSYGFSI